MNKKKWLLFLLGMGFTVSLLSADELKVLKPTAGSYPAGSTMTIAWTFQFMEWLPSTPAQKKLVISIHEYGKQYQGPVPSGPSTDVATADVNAGSCTWKVGDYSTNWDGYIFKIWMKENPAIFAYSAPFQIQRLQIPRIPMKAAAPVPVPKAISVTSPASGQNCTIGYPVTIQWDKSLIASYGYVWLQVCWPNHTGAGGAFTTNNTGSYVWTIAETAENTFCIKVSTQDDKFIGYSGNFNVKKLKSEGFAVIKPELTKNDVECIKKVGRAF
jgi:hypothetical protein